MESLECQQPEESLELDKGLTRGDWLPLCQTDLHQKDSSDVPKQDDNMYQSLVLFSDKESTETTNLSSDTLGVNKGKAECSFSHSDPTASGGTDSNTQDLSSAAIPCMEVCSILPFGQEKEWTIMKWRDAFTTVDEGLQENSPAECFNNSDTNVTQEVNCSFMTQHIEDDSSPPPGEPKKWTKGMQKEAFNSKDTGGQECRPASSSNCDAIYKPTVALDCTGDLHSCLPLGQGIESMTDILKAAITSRTNLAGAQLPLISQLEGGTYLGTTATLNTDFKQGTERKKIPLNIEEQAPDIEKSRQDLNTSWDPCIGQGNEHTHDLEHNVFEKKKQLSKTISSGILNTKVFPKECNLAAEICISEKAKSKHCMKSVSLVQLKGWRTETDRLKEGMTNSPFVEITSCPGALKTRRNSGSAYLLTEQFSIHHRAHTFPGQRKECVYFASNTEPNTSTPTVILCYRETSEIVGARGVSTLPSAQEKAHCNRSDMAAVTTCSSLQAIAYPKASNTSNCPDIATLTPHPFKKQWDVMGNVAQERVSMESNGSPGSSNTCSPQALLSLVHAESRKGNKEICNVSRTINTVEAMGSPAGTGNRSYPTLSGRGKDCMAVTGKVPFTSKTSLEELSSPVTSSNSCSPELAAQTLSQGKSFRVHKGKVSLTRSISLEAVNSMETSGVGRTSSSRALKPLIPGQPQERREMMTDTTMACPRVMSPSVPFCFDENARSSLCLMSPITYHNKARTMKMSDKNKALNTNIDLETGCFSGASSVAANTTTSDSTNPITPSQGKKSLTPSKGKKWQTRVLIRNELGLTEKPYWNIGSCSGSTCVSEDPDISLDSRSPTPSQGCKRRREMGYRNDAVTKTFILSGFLSGTSSAMENPYSSHDLRAPSPYQCEVSIAKNSEDRQALTKKLFLQEGCSGAAANDSGTSHSIGSLTPTNKINKSDLSADSRGTGISMETGGGYVVSGASPNSDNIECSCTKKVFEQIFPDPSCSFQHSKRTQKGLLESTRKGAETEEHYQRHTLKKSKRALPLHKQNSQEEGIPSASHQTEHVLLRPRWVVAGAKVSMSLQPLQCFRQNPKPPEPLRNTEMNLEFLMLQHPTGSSQVHPDSTRYHYSAPSKALSDAARGIRFPHSLTGWAFRYLTASGTDAAVTTKDLQVNTDSSTVVVDKNK